MKAIKVVKPVAFAAALIPAAALVYGFYTNDLTANPGDYITDQTGTWAIGMLTIALGVTPFRRITKWNDAIRLRRMFGLFAFFYAVLHMLTWVVFIHYFEVKFMVEDVVKRPFITVGMGTFLILFVLALTSNRYAVRKLGRKWQTLHRLVYVAAIGGGDPLLVAREDRRDEAGPLGCGVAPAAGLSRVVGVASPSLPVVAVLARAPSHGGKSRLFTELGRPPDRALLEALLLDTLDGCIGHEWSCVVAVEPPAACDEVAALLRGSVAVMPQPAGALGDRLRETMASLLRGGAPAVVLVGSDLPTMSQERIARAWALLEDDPGSVVLGPAADGGYYLVAATSVADVFAGITWGNDTVLAETIAAARRAGITVHLLEPLEDIDVVADLRRLCTETGPSAAAPPERGARTKRWARAHVDGCPPA